VNNGFLAGRVVGRAVKRPVEAVATHVSEGVVLKVHMGSIECYMSSACMMHGFGLDHISEAASFSEVWVFLQCYFFSRDFRACPPIVAFPTKAGLCKAAQVVFSRTP
jgi:hypothetical protein